MTAADNRALTIIMAALIATTVVSYLYAIARVPFAALAASTLVTLALALAWARVKHRREQRPPRQGLRRHMTEAEVERAAHDAIDHPTGPWGTATATPAFDDLAASGIRTRNGLAVARVRYASGVHVVAVDNVGRSYVATMPATCLLLDASAILAHIANCPDRIVSDSDRAAAIAVLEFFQYRAKRTRVIA